MRGYLLFALDTDTVNYSKLAYACALTIKITQPEGYNKVALITNTPTDNPVFDYVIPYDGPKGMDARSRAYDLTPFDETVLLDADVLFLKPMDHYWDLVSDRDLFITTAPQTYRGQLFKYGYYRRIFEENNLVDVYNAWTYFKKTPVVADFFETVKLLTDHADKFIPKCLPRFDLNYIPTDEAFALALGMLELEDAATEPTWSFPRITHMKPMAQEWNEYVTDWTDKLRLCLDNKAQVKLGVWQQTELLHYVDKDLITDNLISVLESSYGT